MLMKEIKPSNVNGIVRIPASKSIIQRAIAAAMLSHGTSVIHNPSTCDDCLAALNIAKQMGATVTEELNRWTISGNFRPSNNELSCGEAGLGIRMFTPIAATLNVRQTLSGHGSLITRPMTGLEDAINQLGASCSTSNGFLPVTVQGPMVGGNATVDGSLSSQILTGLLMAAPLAQKEVNIKVKNLNSVPYIDMTIEIMKQFGINVNHNGYEDFFIASNQSYKATEIKSEGDWSGAAFFLVAGVISGNLRVENISSKSQQADKEIVSAIQQANGKILEENGCYTVEKSQLKAFSFDATNCPDLFPPLAVLAAACKGTSLIKGVNRLKHKESNRAYAIQKEFEKAGIRVEIEGDEMYITGGNPLGCAMDSHNDHRMAMAAATLALIAASPIQINNPECVTKSYPEFWMHLENIQSENHKI